MVTEGLKGHSKIQEIQSYLTRGRGRDLAETQRVSLQWLDKMLVNNDHNRELLKVLQSQIQALA